MVPLIKPRSIGRFRPSAPLHPDLFSEASITSIAESRFSAHTTGTKSAATVYSYSCDWAGRTASPTWLSRHSSPLRRRLSSWQLPPCLRPRTLIQVPILRAEALALLVWASDRDFGVIPIIGVVAITPMAEKPPAVW